MYNNIQPNYFQHGIINSIYNVKLNEKTLNQDNLNLFKKEQIVPHKDLTHVFKILFNNYDYDSILNMLPLMNLPNDEEEKVKKIVTLYKHWDSYDYINMSAHKIDEFPKLLKPIEEQYKQNTKALKKIRQKYKEYQLLIDLINNAKRRNLKGKNNEAILELYRTMELITHIRLMKQYKIDTKNIDINRLEELKINKAYVNYLKGLSNKYNTINIALRDHFALLEQLHDPIGKFYHKNYSLFMDIIKMRHSSLLVHGNSNITAVQYQEYEYIVRQLATMLNAKVIKYAKKTEFPLFELN